MWSGVRGTDREESDHEIIKKSSLINLSFFTITDSFVQEEEEEEEEKVSHHPALTLTPLPPPPPPVCQSPPPHT
ncbi:uncharacterized [Tachysurus ichikawai]